MNKIILFAICCLSLFSCKKEDEITVDFEIYTNVSLDSYKIQYPSTEKVIMHNTSPMGKRVPFNNTSRILYTGSVTAKKDSPINFLFSQQASPLEVTLKIQGETHTAKFHHGSLYSMMTFLK